MKEVVDRILEQVEADISEIDLYGYELLKLLFQWYINCKTLLKRVKRNLEFEHHFFRVPQVGRFQYVRPLHKKRYTRKLA